MSMKTCDGSKMPPSDAQTLFSLLRFLSILLASAALLACPPATEPLPEACGNGALETGEVCDDGNTWGGDGCTPWCSVEEGLLEVESNDSPDEAQELEGPTVIHGALPTNDRDCYSILVGEAGAVGASLSTGPDGSCPFESFIELWDPAGLRVIAGLPALSSGCPAIDPDVETRARYLVAGAYVVCVTGAFDSAAVPGYTLSIEVFDSCTDLAPLPPNADQDIDGDEIADVCDSDDDNDGVHDVADNCPTVPNGPLQPWPWDSSDSGFVHNWLVLGAFTDGITPGGCEPSPDSFTGLADADAAPALGDMVGPDSWFAHVRAPSESAVLRFTDYFNPAAPREAYAAVWIYAPEQRDAVLFLGVDDGWRAWLNGAEVGVISGCQGVGVDQFQFPVTLQMGWNRLVQKVYDGGGGWGFVTRFRYDDGLTDMTDLGVSIGGPADWADNQGDMDGDGVGDVCDLTP